MNEAVRSNAPLTLPEIIRIGFERLFGEPRGLILIWGISCILPLLIGWTISMMCGVRSEMINAGIQARDMRLISVLVVSLSSWIFLQMLGHTMVVLLAARKLRGHPAALTDLPALALRRLMLVCSTTLLVTIAWVVGLVLFIAPGIYALIRFSHAALASAVDGLRPVAAMNHSWRLTAARAGRTALLLGALGCISLIVNYAGGKIIDQIVALWGQINDAASAATGLLINTVHLLITAFDATCMTALYLDLSDEIVGREEFKIPDLSR